MRAQFVKEAEVKVQDEFRLQTAIAALQALKKGSRGRFHRLFSKMPGLSMDEEEKPLPELEAKLLEYIQERAMEEVDRDMMNQGKEEGDSEWKPVGGYWGLRGG